MHIGDKVRLIDDEHDLGPGSVNDFRKHMVLVYFFKDGYKEWIEEELLEEVND